MGNSKWQQVYRAVLKETGDADAAEEAADLATLEGHDKERQYEKRIDRK
jgi:hypothetical protein